jgi:phosphate acyltransferase
LKIALDAAAGDLGTAPNIEGAVQAANAWGLEIVLVGPAGKIEEALKSRGLAASDRRFSIVDAPDVVAMTDDPAAACRARPKSSIMVCAELAAAGKVSGLVSAGHSGATMVAALWHLKRLPGVLRPAIAAPIPTLKGATVLLDAGANVDCKPWHLLHFAAMGAIYAETVLKVSKPKVGILSNGEEDCKGNELVKEAIPLLKCSGLEFFGPVEGRDITAGTTDVVVCDGFVGNVAVKTLEGAGSTIFAMLREEIMRSWIARIGALALRGPFARIKKRMSYDEYGGAPLLGVNGNAVICHGRSNGKAIANALRVASQMAEGTVNERIAKKVDAMRTSLEESKVQI